jgi:hypothetical protein
LLLNADDDGLLARFLPLWPEPAAVRRPSAFGDAALIDGVPAKLLSLDLVTGEDGEARPWYVPFSEPARASMDDFRKALRGWSPSAKTCRSASSASFRA